MLIVKAFSKGARAVSVLVTLASLAGCPAVVGAGGGGNVNGGNGGADGGGGGDGAVDASAGINCVIPTSSGAMLCEQIAACPSLTVNQGSFDQCGFLITGSAINLVCECDGYLCPAISSTSCAAVGTVLQQQNSTTVCNQLSSGGCTLEGLSGPSGSGSGTSSTCDPDCAAECSDDATCITGCGC
jgi:hypothetical protein